jgi:hypothetical protein
MLQPEPIRRGRCLRLRYSLRALMGIIVALAMILAVLSPLFPLRPPPCLTPVRTATWLITKPAAASCTDCHGRK